MNLDASVLADLERRQRCERRSLSELVNQLLARALAETESTAVSLPRRLFEATERAARRRGVPRSRILVEALERYLGAEEESDITARINAALAQPMTESEAEEEAAAAAFVAEAARRLLPGWEPEDDRLG